MVLAHPLIEAAELGVAPAFLAVLAAAVVAVGGLRRGEVGARADHGGASEASGAPSLLHEVVASQLRTPLGTGRLLGRVLGGAGLLLAILAGRLGDPGQFENITPALVIGAGWPLLVLLTALAGDVWGQLNPFDALARPLQRIAGVDGATDGEGGATSRHLGWVAVAGAVGLTWWLGLWLPGGLQPRAIGLGLGLYTLGTLGGCLAVGRDRWLAEAEVLTVAFSAVAAARRGHLLLSAPHVVALSVLAAGLTSAEVRFSRWYLADVGRLGLDPFGEIAAVGGYLLLLLLGIAAVRAARRWAARRGQPWTVDVALAWLVVGVAASAALERDRLWTSVQLLVARAGSPFGPRWSLWGDGEVDVTPWPYGDVTRLWLQAALLIAAGVAGVVAARRREGGPVEPAVVLAGGWVLLAVLSVATG